MKAFIYGVVAAIVISVGAGLILDRVQMSSSDTYASKNVRLPTSQ